ncbi:MAG: MBL fold metallo-hydrolase [Thermoanaerobaculia bacterium]
MVRTNLPRHPRIAILAVLAAACVPAHASDTWLKVKGEFFTFTEVREGIWHAQGTGDVAVGSNGALIVNDVDAMVVDSHMTPAAGRALLEDMALVTDKPVRYLVNTHFHFDHNQGNQAFGPEVEVVAHEWTYHKVKSGGTRSGRAYDYFIGTLPSRIEAARERLAALSDDASAEERSNLQGRIQAMETLWAQDQETEIVTPTLMIRESMTLFRGEREIRIFFAGRAHTGGDVLVYLPAERVLVTGDMLPARLPYMGDGHLLEWATTLESLEDLEIDVFVPGHGDAFESRDWIGHLQAYLRDLWQKAAELHAQGVPPAEAAERIDLTGHSAHYPQIEGPGASPHAVERVYELLDAE